MLWSRVDAQRTMIAMGEMVSNCEEEDVDDDIGKCIEGNGLGKRGRVVGISDHSSDSETRRREKRNSCMAFDDLHGQ